MLASMLLRKFGICFSLIAALTLIGFADGVSARAASTLNVCPSGCPFTQVAAAVAAAKDGDTIQVAPGTYHGGFTINVSVRLAGAGAGKTIISGGGPVITIGQIFAASEPTVSISSVKITGGVTRSSPESVPCTGKDGVRAAGGGIEVPPSTDFSGGACNDLGGGATVTISNSVITGNRVAPSDTVPFAPCGGCPVAWAFGGGIDTSGSLTLAHTTVSDNRVGSASGLATPARFVEGGGIFSGRGDMKITNSTISGNQAAVSPHGVLADAAGIAFDTDTGGIAGGTFTMNNSSVTNNSATVTSDFAPFGFIPSAGIHIKGGAQSASISNSTISGNAATFTNSAGGASVGHGGLQIDICFPCAVTLSNDAISDNRITAAATGPSGNASGGSAAGEIGGTLSNVRITGNSVNVSSAAGNAMIEGGASVFDGGTIKNSLIGDNHVRASAPLGSIDVRGGGINAFGPTTLRNSTVSGNTVNAAGASGTARGGGIFDVAFSDGPNGPPGGPLVLQNSKVTASKLNGTAGLTLQGGGIYLQNEPITLTNSLISGNIPDQCFGC
jgi:hypothetical protein